MKKPTIGIDLGTTNSVVSVMEGGKPTIIINSEGKRTTPSIVSFEDNNVNIGEPAKRKSIVNAGKTIYSVKRLMGKNYKEVEKEINDLTYDVLNENNKPFIKINDKKYTPQEISSRVLQKLKKEAENHIGYDIEDAVITVPAYFNDNERTATKEAGEIAGLNVKRIINEPTAAALSYGLDKTEKDMKVAVFDLGGSTFDISILELGDGVFEVKSTNGDTHLGGDDFDRIIVNWLVDEFKKDFDVDLRKDKTAHQRLREAAEKAKVELSSSSETEINLPYIIPIDNVPQHLVRKLTRSKFEQLSHDLLNKLKEPTNKALRDSNISKNDIDEIILVGGSTRIPVVQNLVKEIFGKEPNKSVNPDEAVAIGAAIQGGVLTGDVKDVLLLDVIPLSLGIETMGHVMTKLIESNTTIPTTKSEVFSTAADNQSSVEIHVLQGERPMVNDNKTLGRFHLDGIPPAQRGIPQIEVKFDIDSNGILSVSAKDKGTNKEQSIRIEGSSSLDDNEIERMKREAEENAEKDKKEKEKVDKLNQADALIFSTEKQIKDLDDKLSDEDKNKLNDIIGKLKESHKNQNIEEVDKLTQELTNEWQRISTNIYQNSANESKNEDSTETKENVEDVDFEEVNDK